MFGITTIPGLVALFTIVGAILSFYIYDYLGIKSKRVKVAEAKDSFDKIEVIYLLRTIQQSWLLQSCCEDFLMGRIKEKGHSCFKKV